MQYLYNCTGILMYSDVLYTRVGHSIIHQSTSAHDSPSFAICAVFFSHDRLLLGMSLVFKASRLGLQSSNG